MKEKVFITRDNIFADLGLADSEEMKIRSDLMSEVVKIIRRSDLPQKEIAGILGITAPKVSALMTGKITDFSNDTLMNYLALLGCNVEIKVSPRTPLSRSTKRGVIKVKKTTVRKKVSVPKARRKKPKINTIK